MKESINEIIIYFTMLLILICSSLFYISRNVDDTIISHSRTGIESRTMEFNIKEGKIYCNDNIHIKLKNEKKVNVFVYNAGRSAKESLSSPSIEFVSHLTPEISKEYISLEVKANNQKIDITEADVMQNGGYVFFDADKYEFLKNEKEINLEINTFYDTSSYVEKFNNMEILTPVWKYEKIYAYENNLPKFKKIGYIKNLRVILNSDVPVDNILSNVNEKYIIENDNLYDIQIPILRGSYVFKLQIGLTGSPVSEENILNKKIYNREYDIEEFDDKDIKDDRIIKIETDDILEEDYIQYIFAIGVTVFSFCILIISICINKKKGTNRYNKNVENLVSPILAETIIDGKTDIKNLIMTAIIEFNIRGNVEIIDNQSIQLISKNNLNEYEQEIMNLIFPENVEKIKFSDINNLFINSNEDTLRFSKIISSIKIKILEYLYSMNVISKKHNIFVDILNSITILLMINFLTILCFNGEGGNILFGFVISLFLVYIYLKKKKEQITIKEQIIDMQNRKNTKKVFVRIRISIVILILAVILTLLNMNIRVAIITVLSIIMNLLTLKINQNNILTSHGKKEREKLLELKNYINQYSLIKDRDLKSAVIWDEYLAYATAFGIPSNVISQIYESWYNINITLQFISSFF